MASSLLSLPTPLAASGEVACCSCDEDCKGTGVGLVVSPCCGEVYGGGEESANCPIIITNVGRHRYYSNLPMHL